MARKPIIVHITETGHKKQPWSVRIERGKTDSILSQRYTSPSSAKRGAMSKKHLNGGRGRLIIGKWMDLDRYFVYPDGKEIKFVVKRRK